MKRIIGLVLGLVMAFNIGVCARNMSTFEYLKGQNSEIVARLADRGIGNAKINSFLTEMDLEADKLNPEEINALEAYFLLILTEVLVKDTHEEVRIAFEDAFQDELSYIYENMEKGKTVIPDSFNEFFLSVMYGKINPEVPVAPVPPPEEEINPEKPPQAEVQPELVFNDVSKDFWAYEHILSLYKKGVVDGYVGKIFRPENKVTRAELAKTVCTAFLNGNYKVGNTAYSDVTEDMWYYDYVKVCEYYSIFDKICDRSFNGGKFVTRQEMCTVIYRAFMYSSKKMNAYPINEFPDINRLAPYAVEAVETLQSYKVISGFEDYKFHPENITTRAEVCKVIDLLLK